MPARPGRRSPSRGGARQRSAANGWDCGGLAGGPVYFPKLYNGRNRTWIFGAYEAFREPRSRSRTRTVLTPSARQDLFTWTLPGGSPQQINLLSIGTLGNSGTRPTLNSDVMNFYNLLVLAEGLTDVGCGGGDGANIRCFTFNLPGKNIADRYTLRLDHQLTGSHSLEFVFNQADFDWRPDLLNNVEPYFPKPLGGSQDSRRQVLTWALHSVLRRDKTKRPASATTGPRSTSIYSLLGAGGVADCAVTTILIMIDNKIGEGRRVGCAHASPFRYCLRFCSAPRPLLGN